jgi:hypothetical protein
MITIPDLKKILKIEKELINQQTNGLVQSDTLIQPQPAGNCMNWVLGHLLESQIAMLEALGGVSPISRIELSRYGRESNPILGECEGILPLDTLLNNHDLVHNTILTRLDEMNETDMEHEILEHERLMKRGWRVFFLHFHYTYHIGQLEQLRQLAGKTEKII